MVDILERNKTINLIRLGDALVSWFAERDWSIKTNKSDTCYSINAKKTNEIRKIFCANRALSVVCSHEGSSTKIKISQGDWTDNLIGNVIWYFATGGANLAFTIWSLRVQKEFRNFAESVLDRQCAF